MKHQQLNQREKGQSFLELAVSATFLLILLAGVMDLGRAFFTFTAMRDAVQEGASYLAVEPNDCAGAIKRVRQHTSQPVNLEDSGIMVTMTINRYTCTEAADSHPPVDTICPGMDIEATVTMNEFRIATPFLGTLIGGQNFPLTAKVTESVVVDPDPVSSRCP